MPVLRVEWAFSHGRSKIMGKIFNIQRFSIHDGPGIRTTVFLKGCMLNCRWCHNPESHSSERQPICRVAKCALCGGCAAVCQNNCHELTGGEHKLDFTACILCGECARICPNGAMEIIGREETAENIVSIALRDEMFYKTSGGGVTVSGGEPFCQPEFLFEILEACKEHGLHTAIETCGMTNESNIRRAAELCDLFLYDFKLGDDELHRRYTGVSNRQIIANLELLCELGKPVILRCPIIPTVNDNTEYFRAIAGIVNRLSNIQMVEVEPYHSLGEAKSEGLGKESNIFETPNAETVDKWIAEIGSMCRCPVAQNK